MKTPSQFIRIGLLLCLVLGILAAAQPARAATLSVCPSCTYHTIIAAVAAAQDGDTISVGSGTYNEHDITMTANLTLHGAGSGLVTVDAGYHGRGFYISSGKTVSISGLTITHGYDAVQGGGVYNAGNLTLDNVILTSNSTDDNGAGIYSSGALTMTNSQVTNNTANDGTGAGLWLGFGTTTHLTDVLIQKNTIPNSPNPNNEGAGIYVAGVEGQVSTLVIDRSTVDQNTSGGFGGGIDDISSTTITITNSTISNNVTQMSGGGLRIDWGSTLVMTNDTVVGNNAEAVGGGIEISANSSATLTNVTLADNNAGEGGGIGVATSTVNVADTIIAGNTDSSGAPDCYGGLNSQGNNLIGNTANCTINGNSNLTNISAKLGALANNGGPTQTMALLTGSPAIDAGSNSTCASTDQRGVTRPQGARCDIGAFEVDNTPPTVVSSLRANASPTHAASVNFTVTFSEAVTGVGTSDFKLSTTDISGASVSAANGSGATRTVTVNTGSGNGALRLDVPTNATITDLAGNPLASLPYTGGETYTITKTHPIYLPVILR